MINISAFSIKNPLPAIMLFVLLGLAGISAFRANIVQDYPDLEMPLVIVSASPSNTNSMIAGRGFLMENVEMLITVASYPWRAQQERRLGWAGALQPQRI